MALGRDEHNILDVFLVQNLANITRNSQFVSAPLGFMQFIDVLTFDNVTQLDFSSDLNELLVNYILVNQSGDIPRVGQIVRQAILERRSLML